MQNVNDIRSAGDVPDAVNSIHANLAGILAREDALERGRAARSLEARREHSRREEEQAALDNARLAELAADHRHAREQAQAASAAREARVRQAYQNARDSLADRLKARRDRKMGSVQGGILATRQIRQKQLAKATEENKRFKAALAADVAATQELRTEIYKTLRSFILLLKPMFQGRRIELSDDAGKMTPDELRAEAGEHIADLRKQAAGLRREPLALLFRFLPLSALLAAAAVVFGVIAWKTGVSRMIPFVLTAGGVLAVWLIGLAQAWLASRAPAVSLATARTLLHRAEQTSTAKVADLTRQIEEEKVEQGQNLSSVFQESSGEIREALREGQQALDAKLARTPARLQRLRERALTRVDAWHQQILDAEQQRIAAAAAGRKRALAEVTGSLENAQAAEIGASLATPWHDQVLAPAERLAALERAAPAAFPPFGNAFSNTWQTPAETPDSIRLGTRRLDFHKMAGRDPHDEQLALPAPAAFDTSFGLGFPNRGSLLIETEGDSSAATGALATAALRILASIPPGRVAFLFIDPVGLGSDFAGLMHLADYEEGLISHRIWTQQTQIEERLAEINEHIEKVIQMYLRNEYDTIEEYNAQAGAIAEKYRFVVIANFPAGFSETAAKRLLAIASSGARCGVHLLIHRDLRLPAPDPALDDQLHRLCTTLRADGRGGFAIVGAPAGTQQVSFEPPPADEDATTLIHRIGRASVDSNRVEVPFSQIAPAPEETWMEDTSAELRVAIGRTGARKLQMLALGKGTRQHVLVAGKTGSGKSTLFHVIITNLALWCRPDMVEFYLIDFKKGVEFKCYATKRLPHARVVAIESDREFALSVLQRVDAELRRRGELFRKAGSQDLLGYKATPGAEPMPRSILLIDEFQEFFTEDDAVAQEASLLLDRIVRQGRAFGIHVILGSQTLGGAYTLARATLGQMVVRVALQCNETDAHLIMDEDNPAPRLLTRPGEGIYNDQAGALAANSPFQIVWLPEAERDAMLDKVRALAVADGGTVPSPLVFEGNAPAEIRDNPELEAALHQHPESRPATAKLWLGAPNSIKGPTAAEFQRQSGSHLLIVCQSTERILSALGLGLISLAAQYPTNGAEFILVDPHAPDSPSQDFFRRIGTLLPQGLRLVGPANLASVMTDLAARLEARANGASGEPDIYLFVNELQRIKALRPEDEFKFSMDDEPAAASPSQVFANLLGEGGPAGIHVIAAIDTWNNVSRWIPRKTLGEFEMRVLFQMSANDSANLIDSPAASALGMHRALFHNEHYGTQETFRPYALPGEPWLEEVEKRMENRR